jgi:AraC-like DNA-binding protein
LHITTIGFQKISPNINYPPKNHPSAYWFNPNVGRSLNEHILLYITEGEGTFESDSYGRIGVAAGELLLLYPGEWHTYQPSHKVGWTEYWIGFNGEHVEMLKKNQFFSKKKPHFKVGFNEQIIALYKQGIEIANQQKTAYQQALAGLCGLLLSLVYYYDKNDNFRDKEIIRQIEKARVMMRESFGNETNPANIAASLNMSYSWFRRIFKKYTGFSPAQYQMEVKIQKAKEFLTGSTIPIKEIAYDLDFESLSYFVTFFKTKTNMSPTEYRNKTRGHSS